MIQIFALMSMGWNCASMSFSNLNCRKTQIEVVFVYEIGDFLDLYHAASSFERIKYILTTRVNIHVSLPITLNRHKMFKSGLDNTIFKLQNVRIKSIVKQNSVEMTLKLYISKVSYLAFNTFQKRQNVVRVAVFFLDGEHCSLADLRQVSRVAGDGRNSLMIFALVFNVAFIKEVVYLNNVLAFPSTKNSASDDKYIKFYLNLMVQALCRECIVGTYFQHRDGIYGSSCYEMVGDILVKQSHSWHHSSAKCESLGMKLATIETTTELDYITNFISVRAGVYFSAAHKSHLFIGLHRNAESKYKVFRWLNQHKNEARSLEVNKWALGKPTDDVRHGCSVWSFMCNNGTEYSCYKYSDYGWEDVSCNKLYTGYILCESSLPVNMCSNKVHMLQTRSSYTSVKNMTGILEIQGHLVSITAHVSSLKFYEFLSSLGYNFPVFDCGAHGRDSRSVSYSFVCDGISQCQNREDETFCPFLEESSTHFLSGCYQTSMSNINDGRTKGMKSDMCCDHVCLPRIYLHDQEFICKLDKMYIIQNICNFADFSVNIFSCLFSEDYNYTIRDVLDGELWNTTFNTHDRLDTTYTCYNQHGDRVLTKTCIFFKMRTGELIQCRDTLTETCDSYLNKGFNLESLKYCKNLNQNIDNKDNVMHKLNPNIRHELNPNFAFCLGLFRCWDSTTCLHPNRVCNGFPECPQGDDEINCNFICPQGFLCLSGTVVYNKTLNQTNEKQILDSRTKYLDMSGLSVEDSQLLQQATKAVVIKLRGSDISSIEVDTNKSIIQIKLIYCQFLDLSSNLFSTVTKRINLYFANSLKNEINNNNSSYIEISFENVRHVNLSYNQRLDRVADLQLTYLEVLDLSHTNLTYLDDTIFSRSLRLQHLNLSHTNIAESLNTAVFTIIHRLASLDIRGVSFRSFKENMFNGLTITWKLQTTSYQICCPQVRGDNIPSYFCHSPPEDTASCNNLIRVPAQRFLLWIMAVFALVGNLTVIIYRLLVDRQILQTGYGVFVINLGVSDFIMGVYLFIIAAEDVYLSGNYVLYDTTWRESPLCQTCGFLATLSHEASTYFVFLITLDRFLVMKFPFGQKRITKTGQILAVIFSWSLSALFALLPIVLPYTIYSSNSLCLGLPLTSESQAGWGFSFGIFIAHNFVLFLMVSFGQIAIFRSMSDNRISSKISGTFRSRRAEDITVAKKLSLVVMSNFLCWFPVGLMGLLSLRGYQISRDVYAWTAAVVLPINSAVNPVLYTIPALLDKWKKFKYGEEKRQVKL